MEQQVPQVCDKPIKVLPAVNSTPARGYVAASDHWASAATPNAKSRVLAAQLTAARGLAHH
jgi:hypothetical protein